MSFIPSRSLLRRLLAAFGLVFILLFALWLALPRLLGLAAERWLDVPGLDAVRVDIARIGAGHARLRAASAVYRSTGGDRLVIALHDIALDYSLVDRHVERLVIGRGELDVFPAAAAKASPWPQLTWPTLPLSEARIDDLKLSVQRPQLAPLQTRGKLDVRQTAGQLQAEFRPGTDLLRLTASQRQRPDGEYEFHVEWSPADGAMAEARLNLGAQPAQQPARLVARVPLPLLARLARSFGMSVPLTNLSGTVALSGEALLGENTGTLRTLSGTAELEASAQLTPNGWPLNLDGKLRFTWKPPLAQFALQPGLRWQLRTAGEDPLQASGRLNKAFEIHFDDVGGHTEGELPFTLVSPHWGRWDGAAQRIRLKKGSDLTDWSSADLDLRIKGQLEQWQRAAFVVRDVKAAGDVALHWSSTVGLRSELAMQAAVGRVSWSGESPLNVSTSTWKLSAKASAKAGDDFWQSLTLQGEASSPQIKVTQGTTQKAGPVVTLGATRLQLQPFRPAGWQDAKVAGGELLLSADAIRHGNWPAPALRARLRLDRNSVHADGALLLAGTEALAFAGSHPIAGNCGAATLSAQHTLPTLGKLLQPRPPALLALDFPAGDAQARFALDWCLQPTPKFDLKGTLAVRDAALRWDKARVDALQATLRLDGLQPLRGRVQLAAQRGELATGTALTDLDVDLALAAQTLAIHAFDVKLLGGGVHVEPLTRPWPPSEQTLPVEIRALDLAQLLALIDVPGLSASGRLSGLLPLNFRDGSVEIDNGQLSSLGAGTIKYAPTSTIPDNPGLQALRNFHFEQLGTHLWYAADGAYRVQTKLEGSNPGFYDGYPVRFRLNINGKLPGLFRSAVFSGDFNRHILEQLQSGKLE